jgi:hypothetical protein
MLSLFDDIALDTRPAVLLKKVHLQVSIIDRVPQ